MEICSSQFVAVAVGYSVPLQDSEVSVGAVWGYQHCLGPELCPGPSCSHSYTTIFSFVLRAQGKFYVPYYPSEKNQTSVSFSILIFLEFLTMCVPMLVIILYVCKARAALP